MRDRRPCTSTATTSDAERFGDLAVYGSDAPLILELARADPTLGDRLDPALPTIGAEVVWAARHEMARTVEDALARRSRGLFLDARAAIRMAPRVAELMAKELGRDDAWRTAQVEAFTSLATRLLAGLIARRGASSSRTQA